MSTAVPDILRSLRCDRAANDRRRHPRVGLRARVTIETLERICEPQPAWLRDLSAGGAGLLVPVALRVDQSIVVRLPVEGGQTMPVRCRVAHCTKSGSFWRAGVEFIDKPWDESKPTVILAQSRMSTLTTSPPTTTDSATAGSLPEPPSSANDRAAPADGGIEAEVQRISTAVLA